MKVVNDFFGVFLYPNFQMNVLLLLSEKINQSFHYLAKLQNIWQTNWYNGKEP
jgi:hypothetical protein